MHAILSLPEEGWGGGGGAGGGGAHFYKHFWLLFPPRRHRLRCERFKVSSAPASPSFEGGRYDTWNPLLPFLPESVELWVAVGVGGGGGGHLGGYATCWKR